jgi:hypothetical protein
VATPEEARALLSSIDALREQVDPIDDPGRSLLRSTLMILRDQAQAVAARAEDESRRAKRGVGAPPRYTRSP